MSDFIPYKWAKCPIPGCDEDLIMSLTTPVYVDDVPLTELNDVGMRYAEWETGCSNGHVVDCGGSESDGRTVIHGYRNAQSLGGLR